MRRPDALSLRETLRGVIDELEAAGIESPRPEAERLVSTATGIPLARLALHLNDRLEPSQASVLAPLVARRAAGAPLQYVEGTAAFRGLMLKADLRALVPRPETEQLVELVAERLRAASLDGAAVPPTRGVRRVPRPGEAAAGPAGRRVERALDIGTGSGAIAIALVAEDLVGSVVAVDRSAAALEQAGENLALTGVDASRIELRQCGDDPYDALSPAESFDLVVSNPPYVTDREMESLPRDVRHEPPDALAGGADGLSVVRVVVDGAPAHLVRGGRLFLEIGADQATAVKDLLRGDPWHDVRSSRDLSGRDRFVEARRD